MGEHDKSGKVKAFKTQLGLTSTVNREKDKSEKSLKANAQLADIGPLLNPNPDGMKYMGSAAVHIYYNETLNYVALATQADGLIVNKCPSLLAQTACTDLVGTVMEKYGMKRPTKRNGF